MIAVKFPISIAHIKQVSIVFWFGFCLPQQPYLGSCDWVIRSLGQFGWPFFFLSFLSFIHSCRQLIMIIIIVIIINDDDGECEAISTANGRWYSIQVSLCQSVSESLWILFSFSFCCKKYIFFCPTTMKRIQQLYLALVPIHPSIHLSYFLMMMMVKVSRKKEIKVFV